MGALRKPQDTGGYVSDRVYDGIRHKDADAAARHADRVKRALRNLARSRAENVKEDA